MITRRLLLASAAALAFAAPAFAEEKLKVIATFSILGDIVANVGGDRVEVTTLVGSDGDAHVFQPAPADAQAAADPAGAETYATNAAAYLAELDVLDAEIRAAVAALPEDRRTVVTSHDAFGYFAADYGLAFVAPQGVSTEAEASAQDVAALITQIRDAGIAAVFVENIADRRLLDQIATETGAAIGGTLYSDALSAADGPAATYLAMMRHNPGQLTGALSQ
jgi:ABC-type Zn uptake system ZnuABC Zn-binding protein ZnuA